MSPVLPSLFGISHSNRNFSDAYYWGKNQFNSAFPVALACYMRSRGIPLMYVQYKDEKSTKVSEVGLDQVFGSTLPDSKLYFAFESRFEPFGQFVHDDLPAIDLIVCAATRDAQIKPLEIKLTTLPDNTTEALSEDQYGAELVIRSATTRYMALSMAQSVDAQRKRVREIFEPALAKVRNWDSKSEMLAVAPVVVSALERFLNEFSALQTPLLMQPIWKTVGKSPVLANQCLDIFVWSDFALAHLFLDSARNAATGNTISRQLRAALRLSRFIYERSRTDKVYQAPIYDGMTYDHQNDKEFAISGTKSRTLMTCPRLTQPIIGKDEIKNIILGGGQKYLSPERRFDAILYFSNDLFESEE
jgi:HindVP restriction endonuclease